MGSRPFTVGLCGDIPLGEELESGENFGLAGEYFGLYRSTSANNSSGDEIDHKFM